MQWEQSKLPRDLTRYFSPVFVSRKDREIEHVLFAAQGHWFILTPGAFLGIRSFPLMLGMAGLCVQKKQLSVRAFHQIGLGWDIHQVKEGVGELIQEAMGELFFQWSKKEKTMKHLISINSLKWVQITVEPSFELSPDHPPSNC